MKRFFYVAIIFCVFSRCSETVEEEIALPVTLKGKVSAIGEFGYSLESGAEGIEVSVGKEPAISTKTDEEGNYELTLTTGTYDIKVSKEGFGENLFQGIKLIGGTVPSYSNFYIYQKSSTKYQDLKFGINNSQLTISGNVSHSLPDNNYSNYIPMILFLSKSPDVSASNYDQIVKISIDIENVTDFKVSIYYSSNLFPSGTTLYGVAYGVGSYDSGYIDYESGRTIYPSLGETPSNVASIKVP